MEPIYCIQLTRAEYEYLLRSAPDGIQAAMEATLHLEYPDLGNPWEERHDRSRRLREGTKQAAQAVRHTLTPTP